MLGNFSLRELVPGAYFIFKEVYMPFGIQPVHLIVIALVALLVFGPSKLPDIGRGVGKALVEFKRGLRDMSDGFDEEVSPPATPAVPVTTSMIYQPVAISQPATPNVPVQATPKPGVVYCSICGSPNLSAARFCNACGSPLAVVSIETADHSLESQCAHQSVVVVHPVSTLHDEPVDSAPISQ